MRRHLSFANAVSLIALFVALGGGAYAATALPKNSVGPRQPAGLTLSAAAGANGASAAHAGTTRWLS